jgi:hypothetical protein
MFFLPGIPVVDMEHLNREHIRKTVGLPTVRRPLDVVFRLRASRMNLAGQRLPNDDGHVRKLVGRPGPCRG